MSDRKQVDLAGRVLPAVGDIGQALSRTGVPWANRLFDIVLSKGFRRTLERVTFDRSSFEAARDALPRDHAIVIVPTHRSYLDFLLCPYLFVHHPELGFPVPRIAATENFGRLPGLGWLLERAGAFYIKRGVGKADPGLNHRIERMVRDRQLLMVFIEGMRSRSRRHLSPRRGILRSLQATGHPVALLPVSLAYDRLPEEGAILRELRGEPRRRDSLGPLFRWTRRAWSGEIDLGRAHMNCGLPVLMDSSSDVHHVAHSIIARHQEIIPTSTFHLRRWIGRHPEAGIDLPWLIQALERRGASVIESSLAPEDLDHETDRCLESYWMHHFYPDILAWMPDLPAIVHHVRTCGFAARPVRPLPFEDGLERLLTALFSPICDTYAEVARFLDSARFPAEGFRVADLCRALPGRFRPDIESALAEMVELLMLGERESTFHRGASAGELAGHAHARRWRAPERREMCGRLGA